MKKITKKIVILYDGDDCLDGFGSAWAAWKKFGNKAEYIGVLHRNLPPRGLKNKIIYMIDFTYSASIIKKLIKDNIRVTSIDHHISAEKAIKLTQEHSYSLDHSSCVLAWKYFFPKKPVPRMLKYIEDSDLWKHKLPHTKEVYAYFKLFDFSFKLWNRLMAEIENKQKFKEVIKLGSIILKYQTKLVGQLVNNNAELVKFSGYKVLMVNSSLFNSQIGYLLSKKRPPFGVIWERRMGGIHVSLRSDGGMDVSKIAQKYGGGGHKRAAGFYVDKNKKLPWKSIKK